MRDLFNEKIKWVIICLFKWFLWLGFTMPLSDLAQQHRAVLLITPAGSLGPKLFALLNPDGAFGAAPSKLCCHNCI